MIKNKNLDGFIGLTLFLLSLFLYFFIIPSQVKNVFFRSSRGLSPSIFPKVSVILIGSTSLLLMVENFILKRQTKNVSVTNRGIIIILHILAYYLLMRIFGYYISTFIFLFAIVFYLNKYSKSNMVTYLLIIIFFLFAIFVSFEKILGVFLPKGNLFF